MFPEGWIEDLQLNFSCDLTWQPSYSIWNENAIEFLSWWVLYNNLDEYYHWSPLPLIWKPGPRVVRCLSSSDVSIDSCLWIQPFDVKKLWWLQSKSELFTDIANVGKVQWGPSHQFGWNVFQTIPSSRSSLTLQRLTIFGPIEL